MWFRIAVVGGFLVCLFVMLLYANPGIPRPSCGALIGSNDAACQAAFNAYNNRVRGDVLLRILLVCAAFATIVGIRITQVTRRR
jgi:hypothetical protein